MKLVIVGLAGSVALMGVSSVGIAQAPEKDERPAARRAAPQTKGAPTPRAARPQVQKPAARVPAQRPAVQRAHPQRPAAVQRAPQQRAVERGPAQKKQRLEPNRGGQDRQARDRREQDKLRQRQATPPAQSVDPKQVEKGLRRPDLADKEDRRQRDELRQRQAPPPPSALTPSKSTRGRVAPMSPTKKVSARSPSPVSRPPTSNVARSVRGCCGRATCSASPAVASALLRPWVTACLGAIASIDSRRRSLLLLRSTPRTAISWSTTRSASSTPRAIL